MSEELKRCPFCGGEAAMEHVSQLWEPKDSYWVVCQHCRMSGKHYDTEQEAIDAWNTRHVDGSMSDGYHTFDELYYHRTALFACLVSIQPRQMAFKSRVHADGTMYPGYFIAGIYTSRGWCTYHVEDKWWPLFDCSELIKAPEWDGHTPSDAIHRLMHDMLPKQEVSGEVGE